MKINISQVMTNCLGSWFPPFATLKKYKYQWKWKWINASSSPQSGIINSQLITMNKRAHNAYFEINSGSNKMCQYIIQLNVSGKGLYIDIRYI